MERRSLAPRTRSGSSRAELCALSSRVRRAKRSSISAAARGHFLYAVTALEAIPEILRPHHASIALFTAINHIVAAVRDAAKFFKVALDSLESEGVHDAMLHLYARLADTRTMWCWNMSLRQHGSLTFGECTLVNVCDDAAQHLYSALMQNVRFWKQQSGGQRPSVDMDTIEGMYRIARHKAADARTKVVLHVSG